MSPFPALFLDEGDQPGPVGPAGRSPAKDWRGPRPCAALLFSTHVHERTFASALPRRSRNDLRNGNVASTVGIDQLKGTGVNSATRPPTVDELRQDATVQQALEDAWLDSLPHDSALRHEEGGWIYMDLNTGHLTVRRAAPGLQAELEIGNPPVVADCILVGTFHTHPNPMDEGWDPGPSDADQAFHAQYGLPGLIRADDGVHSTGPDSRRGGLAGGPGYPV
jgi:hypothetical protein